MFEDFCTYYKGEENCPFEAGKGHAGKFWVAENFVCREYARTVEKQTELDFFRMVCAYIAKWAPYQFVELIREYLKNSKASEEIRMNVSKLYF